MSDTTVIGNVGEPKLSHTPSGRAVLEFSLAENHFKKNQQGGWDEDGTTWRRVSLWGDKGEALYNVIKKGDKVVATGAERIREWESKDGSKGQSLELNAREVGIVVKVPKQQGNQQGGNQWGNQPPQQDPWATPGVSNAGGWGNGPDSEPPF